jgi:hypothetical protein
MSLVSFNDLPERSVYQEETDGATYELVAKWPSRGDHETHLTVLYREVMGGEPVSAEPAKMTLGRDTKVILVSPAAATVNEATAAAQLAEFVEFLTEWAPVGPSDGEATFLLTGTGMPDHAFEVTVREVTR